jgi:hypothetical protein
MSLSHSKREKAAKRFQLLRHVVQGNARDPSNRDWLERMKQVGWMWWSLGAGNSHCKTKRAIASDRVCTNAMVVDENLYEIA